MKRSKPQAIFPTGPVYGQGKPKIIIQSDPDPAVFRWYSDFYDRAQSFDSLMAKAMKIITATKNHADAIERLTKAGFEVIDNRTSDSTDNQTSKEQVS